MPVRCDRLREGWIIAHGAFDIPTQSRLSAGALLEARLGIFILAELERSSVDVLLDTGTASTVVSLAVAREHGITLNKLDSTGGGAGGANLEIHALVGAKLSLGEVQPRPRALLAMDLTHVNQSLALKGEPPVDVILGADVFEAQAAVIDYGSSSLFLKR